MYNQINSDALTKAGRFLLSDVTLTSYQSADGANIPKRIGVRSLVVEINIYESIYSKGLSGNIVLVDGLNIANHLPLTGFERVEFKLATPGVAKGYDFTPETGHPMFIYKISGRKGIAPRTQMYVLHFCSKEMIDNEQIKVKQAYSGTIDEAVIDIFRNKLQSKKTLIVEETRGVRKYVMPRLKPFNAIDLLSKEAESKRFNNAGMLFYEDAVGYRFRSLENMLAITEGSARPVVGKFQMKPRSIKGGSGVTNIIEEMQTVDAYSILSQYDTLKNLSNGVYASRTITHDQFNKTFEEIDFDYHNFYQSIFHTEHDGNGGKTDNKGQLPLFNYKNNKFFSDFAEGTEYAFSTTSNIHDEHNYPDYGRTIPKRLAQRLSFASMNISLDARGFTGISAGDLCSFEMPSYEPAGGDNPLNYDPYMSGRYLVKSIRHKIDTSKDLHTMNLECMKDAVRKPYPEESIDTFTDRENTERLNVIQDQLDDLTIKGANEDDNTMLT